MSCLARVLRVPKDTCVFVSMSFNRTDFATGNVGVLRCSNTAVLRCNICWSRSLACQQLVKKLARHQSRMPQCVNSFRQKHTCILRNGISISVSSIDPSTILTSASAYRVSSLLIFTRQCRVKSSSLRLFQNSEASEAFERRLPRLLLCYYVPAIITKTIIQLNPLMAPL